MNVKEDQNIRFRTGTVSMNLFPTQKHNHLLGIWKTITIFTQRQQNR